MITTDRGFIQFLRSEFGFWLLGSSDRGSQRSLGNLTFSLLCAGCHAVEKMTENSYALKRAVATRLLLFLVSARFCFDTDVGYIIISLIVILNATTHYPAIVALYLAYHLTRQTICGLCFSRFF